jgi:hypothetical protein
LADAGVPIVIGTEALSPVTGSIATMVCGPLTPAGKVTSVLNDPSEPAVAEPSAYVCVCNVMLIVVPGFQLLPPTVIVTPTSGLVVLTVIVTAVPGGYADAVELNANALTSIAALAAIAVNHRLPLAIRRSLAPICAEGQ